jgi:hypothetical protein
MKGRDRLKARFGMLLAVLLCAWVAACGQPSRQGPAGYIYFGSGSYLGKFSLRNGSSEMLGYVGDVNVSSVGNYKSGELLLTATRLVNSREAKMVVRYELANKHYTNLFLGDLALFLPRGEVTVYDDGLALQSTRIIEKERKITKILAHDFDEKVSVVPVTDSSFLFQVAKGNWARIFLYDTATESLESLEKLAERCNLDGAIWVSERQSLLCRGPLDPGPDPDYRYLSLQGELGETLQPPDGHALRPLLYLPDQRVIVLTESWRGVWGGKQKYAVWIHSPASGEIYRLVKDQYLGEHVAYRPL